MAQTIKIRRGGIGTLATTAPGSIGSGIAAGELILGTGSFNGLTGPLLLAANAANTVSPAYSRIDTIANGPALESAIGASGDVNLTGLTIHSGSKFYRYSGVNGTGFEELSISAGSFDGTLGVANGGTGQTSLNDIVGDGKIIVQNGTETIIGGDAVLTLGGGVVTGSAQIDGANITNNTVGFGGVSVALGSSDATPAFDLQDATNYPGDSNLVTVGTVTAGDVSAILPTGTVSGSAQIDGTAIINNTITIAGNSTALGGSVTLAQITDGSGIISSSAQIDELFNVDGLISSSVLSSPSQGTALLTNNGVDGSNIDLGLQTDDSPTFANLTLTGDLTVQGTTTTIDSETLNISSSIVRVNFGGAVANGGMEVTDATGGTTVTGSLLWNGTEDYWIAGPKASEKRIVRLNADMADNSFVIAKGEDLIDDVAATTAGDILQWDGSSMVASNIIDGGTF